MNDVSLFIKYLNNEKKIKENSIKVYKTCLTKFNNFLFDKKIEISNVNKDFIEYFFNDLIEKNISNAALKQYLSCLKEYFDFLEKNGEIKSNPTINYFLKNEKRNNKIYFLNKEKIDLLFSLNKARKDQYVLRDESILELFYCTGITVVEMINLTFTNCNFERRFIRVKSPKGKERIVPFSESCRNYLKSYISDYRIKIVKNNMFSDYVFLNADGEPFTSRGINQIFKSIKKKTKFKYNLTPSILRNSFCVNLTKNGANLNLIKDLMGYKSLDFIGRISSSDEDEIKQEYKKLFKIK